MTKIKVHIYIYEKYNVQCGVPQLCQRPRKSLNTKEGKKIDIMSFHQGQLEKDQPTMNDFHVTFYLPELG